MVADINGIMRWANDNYRDMTGLDVRMWMNKDTGEISRNGYIHLHGNTDLMYNDVNKTGCCVTRIIDFPKIKNVTTTALPYKHDNKLDLIMYFLALPNTDKNLIDLENINISEDDFIVKNHKMKAIYSKAHQVAPYDASILITGESGTGKDKLAEYIHKKSLRKGKFVHINCGAIPEQLFESNMFGYEPGAFTGALKGGYEGFIMQASGGTLFLDEIGDMPIDLQTKLLTFLEHKQFIKVGGENTLDSDTRVIAATNKDLRDLVDKGSFREDLFYRLATVELELPALRERIDEIPDFIDFFSHLFNARYKKNVFFDDESIKMLSVCDWRGNIRELKHTVEKVVLLSPQSHINPDLILSECGSLSRKIAKTNDTLKKKLGEYEKSLIKSAIENTRTLLDASNFLSIDLSTLTRKRQKYKI